jgi:WD40 repeat protein
VTALFVSHSSADDAATASIRDRLRGEGIGALFVDFDPTLGIPPGRKWERELYAQLRRADAILFLSSPASVTSHWCFAEIALGRLLGKAVYPIIIEAGPQHALLGDTQHIDVNTGHDGGLERLWAALRADGLDPHASFAWNATRSPYPGLSAFTEEDAAVFFGRDAETERLWQLLQPTLHGRGRVVAVVGPSGSGKSSLVRAGLLPRLVRLPERWLVVPRMVPSTNPTRQLARSLAQAFKERSVTKEPLELARQVAGGVDALTELVEELRDTSGGGEPPSVLLTVDQAEELATRADVTERGAFLDVLRGSVEQNAAVWVLFTVRAEFLGPLLQEPGTGPLVDETLLVSPLPRARLAEVIERPAARAGLQFAPGLIGRLVEDTHGGDALPLLAFALRQLAERVGPDGEITSDMYDAIGGVVGALRATADTTAAELGARGLGDLVVPTLTGLATVTGAGEPTRRRVPRSNLSASEDEIVQAFVEARLLVTDEEQGEPVVEVAHEALVRQWQPLRQAIEARRAELRLRAELERWVLDWEQANRRASYLIGGDRLQAVRDWTAAHPRELALLPGASAFIESSLAIEERAESERLEAERQRQVSETRGVIERLRADAEQATALLTLEPARALAWAIAVTGANLEQLGGEPLALVQASLFAAVRSAKEREVFSGHDQPVTGVAVDPGGRWIASGARDRTVRLWRTSGDSAPIVLGQHDGAVLSVAVSGNGEVIASAGADRVVRLWRPDGSAIGRTLEGSADSLLDVAISPDGTMIAAGSGDGAVYVWMHPNAEPPVRLAHRSYVSSISFSPHGDLLAAGCGDGRLVLWRLGPEPEPMIFDGHADFVSCIRFGPDGRLLASAGGDGTLRLWTVDGHGMSQLSSFGDTHRSLVRSLAFSPDGSALVYGDESGTVQLTDLLGHQIHPPLICPGHAVSSVAVGAQGGFLVGGAGALVYVWDWLPHRPATEPGPVVPRVPLWDRNGDQTGPAWSGEDFVAAVAFTPDGTGVVTAGGDRSLRLWGLDGRIRAAVSNAHDGGITSVACTSRDGGLIATGGRDLVVRFWDLSGRPLADPLTGHEFDVMSVAFRSDGLLLASGSSDGTVRLWRTDGQPVGEPIIAHPDGVEAVDFSPDGALLASSGVDGTVRLWDVDGAPFGQPFAGHVGLVWDVAFSPDGRAVMSCGADRTVRLWDLHGATIAGPLRGHTGGVRAGRFHPAGQPMATAGEDGSVRAWVREGVQLIRPLEGHQGCVFALAMSPTGELAATGGEDGTVRLWRLGHWRSWLQEACHRLVHHPVLNEQIDDIGRAARDACRAHGVVC